MGLLTIVRLTFDFWGAKVGSLEGKTERTNFAKVENFREVRPGYRPPPLLRCAIVGSISIAFLRNSSPLARLPEAE